MQVQHPSLAYAISVLAVPAGLQLSSPEVGPRLVLGHAKNMLNLFAFHPPPQQISQGIHLVLSSAILLPGHAIFSTWAQRTSCMGPFSLLSPPSSFASPPAPVIDELLRPFL